jgi:hypothetical protein
MSSRIYHRTHKYCHVLQWLIRGTTSNYSALAVSTLYNSLLRTRTRTHTSHMLVTHLSTRAIMVSLNYILRRPKSNASSTTNFPRLSPTGNWLIRSAYCLQHNPSARTPPKHSLLLLIDACYSFVAWQQAFAWRGPHKRNSFPYIVVTFLSGRCSPAVA